MKKSSYILLLLLTFSELCFGAQVRQDPDPVPQLFGKVVDASTHEVLSYASVTLRGTDVSNVSNSEGVFSLKIPRETSSEAIVNVSFLGYLTAAVSVGMTKRELQVCSMLVP